MLNILGNTKEILNEIKSTVREFISDAEVMLFGSRARGDARLASDFDILIITKEDISAKSKFPLRTNIRVALLKKGIRSDVLLQSKKEVEKKKTLPGHIIRRIFNEAILL